MWISSAKHGFDRQDRGNCIRLVACEILEWPMFGQTHVVREWQGWGCFDSGMMLFNNNGAPFSHSAKLMVHLSCLGVHH